MKMLNDTSFRRVPEMIRALVPACVSLQIPVKMGMKLVAQTAALFWSVEHVFCAFEVGIVPFLFGINSSAIPVSMATVNRTRWDGPSDPSRSKNCFPVKGFAV